MSSTTQSILDKYFQNLIAPLTDAQPNTAAGILVGVTQFSNGAWNRFYTSYGAVPVLGPGSSPSTEDIVVFIGSNTKVFTATQLALAHFTGSADLATRVDSLLPSGVTLQQQFGDIELWHLATHSAGYPDGVCGALVFGQYPFDAMTTFLKNFSPLYAPGQYWVYSNQGFALLAVLLSHAYANVSSSGWDSSYMQWPQDVISQITQPLKMLGTQVDYSAVRASVAQGYKFMGAGKPFQSVAPPDWDLSSAGLGAGALSSTLSDMLTFLEAQMGSAADSTLASAIALTQTPQPSSGALSMGLGWQIGNGYFCKNGGLSGYESYMAFDPTARLGIFAVANTSPGSGGGTIGSAVDFAARSALGDLRQQPAKAISFPAPPKGQTPQCPPPQK